MLLLLLTAAGFAWWSYRRTLPPVPQALRVLLAVLRWGGMTGAVLLLAQPVLEISRSYLEPAQVVVLLDRSASMGLAGAGDDRPGRVRALLSSDAFDRLEQRCDVRLYPFADSLGDAVVDLEPLLDEPPTGVGTNISGALPQMLAEAAVDNPAAVLLISDGAHNQGPDPARLAKGTPVPVYTIGVGSLKVARDIMLSRLTANPVVYAGSRVPVNVVVRGEGLSGRSAKVRINDSHGKVVYSGRVVFSGDYDEEEFTAEVQVAAAGKARFTCEVEVLEGELTAANNRRSFYLNVLPGRMRVLLYAGWPDNSLGDLIRRLKADQQVALTTRTIRDGGFYEGGWLVGAALDSVDVLLLHHFPPRGADRGMLKKLADDARKKELPVGWFDGGDVDYRRLELFGDLLPVSCRPGPVRYLSGSVVPVKRHAVIADPEELDFRSRWAKLPPLTFTAGCLQPKPGAEVLAELVPVGGGESRPALVVSDKRVKSAAFLGNDPWRWGLAAPGEEGVWQPLLSRLIRWLALRRTAKRVEIDFGRDVYSNREPVDFTVYVRDESYEPLAGAEVRVTVETGGERGGEARLEQVGTGLFRGRFQPWKEGEYRVTAVAVQDTTVIGRDAAAVTVEPFSVELLNTRLNETLLRQVAVNSGGGYAPAAAADSLLNTLDFPERSRESVDRLAVTPSWWLLIVIIGVLALEWFIRIRAGML